MLNIQLPPRRKGYSYALANTSAEDFVFCYEILVFGLRVVDNKAVVDEYKTGAILVLAFVAGRNPD